MQEVLGHCLFFLTHQQHINRSLFFPRGSIAGPSFLFPIQGDPEIDVSFLSVVRATHDINFEVTRYCCG